MQIIEDQVYAFSRDNKPCAAAKPGEVLVFKTLDCFSNRIPDEQTTMADLDYTYGFANPAAGPVFVEGAEPGDVLVVDIFDIEVADEGTIATDDHCGPLFETTGYRTKKVPVRDGMATFNEVSFPIDPMIGVIGTAPSGPDVIDGFVARVCTSPCASRARCCRWATCTPPWVTRSSAARASRFPPPSPCACSW